MHADHRDVLLFPFFVRQTFEVFEHDACRQFQIRQVQDVADLQRTHVDDDGFRQIFRQTGHFHFDDVVVDQTFLVLHPDALFFVDEVQRNLHGDFLVREDALEVDVHRLVRRRMPLHVAREHLATGATEFQRENLREERIRLDRLRQVVLDQRNVHRRLTASVDDARYHRGISTQAAARTFPDVGARFRNQLDLL